MEMFDDVRAVTFDCWGTLLRDRDMAAATALREGAVRRLLGVDEERARVLLQEAWDRHHDAWTNVGTFGPGRMAAYCVEAAGDPDDRATLTELTREFEEATLETGVDATPGARETLAKLEATGVGRALVCDTGMTPGRVVRTMLEDLGLEPHLEFLAFSDEVGVPKPDPAIFAKALAELGAT